jgi:molybdopterin converting factor small subunit
VADVHLPPTLPPLFPGLPRRLDLEAATVGELLEALEARWPGLRDRLCEPGPKLRTHIHVYVDGERAALDGTVKPRSRVDVITAISGGCLRDAASATDKLVGTRSG